MQPRQAERPPYNSRIRRIPVRSGMAPTTPLAEPSHVPALGARPHWSSSDWLDEVQAIILSSAACAGLDFDRSRRVPFPAHVYMRATAAVWTRYRQEWSCYLHSALNRSRRSRWLRDRVIARARTPPNISTCMKRSLGL